MRDVGKLLEMTAPDALQWSFFLVAMVIGVCLAAKARLSTLMFLFILFILALLCNPLHSSILVPASHPDHLANCSFDSSLSSTLSVDPSSAASSSSSSSSSFSFSSSSSSSDLSGLSKGVYVQRSTCMDPRVRLNLWHQSKENVLSLLSCAGALYEHVAETGTGTQAAIRYIGAMVVGFLVGFILVQKIVEMLTKSHSTWLEMKTELAAIDQQHANEQDPAEVAHAEGELQHVPFSHRRLSAALSIRQSEQFFAEMNRRRSLRFFSSDEVPIEVIQNIVRTAGTAPSGAHIQPWTYVVVQSPELKQEIRQLVEKEEQMNYERRMGEKWLEDLRPLKTDWQKAYLSEAPYLVLLFKHAYRLMEDGSRRTAYYNEISASISAGLFLAAVQTAGLVTLTSTPMNAGPAISRLLGRPKNEKLLLLLPVGLPAPGATVPDLKRKSLEDIMVVC